MKYAEWNRKLDIQTRRLRTKFSLSRKDAFLMVRTMTDLLTNQKVEIFSEASYYLLEKIVEKTCEKFLSSVLKNEGKGLQEIFDSEISKIENNAPALDYNVEHKDIECNKNLGGRLS